MGQKYLQMYPNAHTPNADIADPHAVASALDENNPDVVINTAGKTGRPNIDWCEDHKLETLHANVMGPLVLAQECLKRDIYLVHLSSGCIYEGDNGGRGFSEEDAPNFFGSFYSKTKAWSEQMLKEFPVLILRLRMPFEGSTAERNLIIKLTKYPRVLDVQNSLTYLPDFLDVSKKLIEQRKTGIYNVVNPGLTSPFEIMQKYKEMVKPDHEFEKLTLEDLPNVTKAGRSNCVLSTDKLQEEGITLRPITEALEEALEMMKS